MICKKCGFESQQSINFCIKCGAPMTEETASPAAEPPETVSTDNGTTAEKTADKGFWNKRNLIIIIIAAVVLIGGAITAILLIRGDNSYKSIDSRLEAAEKYLNNKEYEQALSEYDKILEDDPDNIELILKRSEVLVAMGKKEQAINALSAYYKTSNDPKIKKRLDELLGIGTVSSSSSSSSTSSSSGTGAVSSSASSSSASTPVSSVPEPSEPSITEDDLRDMLMKEIGNMQILVFLADDYEKNGELEAFAKVKGEGNDNGFVYYVSKNGAEKVCEFYYNLLSGESGKVIETASKKFFAYVVADIYSAYDFVFGVVDGKWHEEIISDFPEETAFPIKSSADSDLLTVNILWADVQVGQFTKATKSYYFFVDSEGIKEYGAAYITEEQLLNCKGAEKILNEIKDIKSAKITDILYRSNGLIHINYTIPGKYEGTGVCNKYVTLKLNEQSKSVELVSGNGNSVVGSSGSGIYLPTHIGKDKEFYKEYDEKYVVIPEKFLGMPVVGSMGTVEIFGAEFDIATTTKFWVDFISIDYKEPDTVDDEELKKISKLINLKELTIYSEKLCDLSPLVALTELEELNLCGNNHASMFINYPDIKDITPITKLKKLKTLTISSKNENVIDLKPLTEIKTLTSLNLSFCKYTDIKPLSELTKLEYLSLGSYYYGCKTISDISPLANLTELKTLCLANQKISDIKPLANLKKLEHLELGDPDGGGNMVSDLSPLAGLTNLKELEFGRNKVSDLKPLAGLVNLTRLEFERNNVKDLSPLANLKKLEYLNFAYNKVTDVTPLEGLTNLKMLYYLGYYPPGEEPTERVSDSDIEKLQKKLPNCLIMPYEGRM